MMEINKAYLTINQYSRPNIDMGTVKGVVIHWVANPNTRGIANRNYFEGLKVGKKNSKGDYIYGSSHYIVGLEGEVIAPIPETEVAYHASTANKDHIGIEVCHPDWGGKFSDATYQSLIELTADICKRYELDPLTAIIRHYDVTSKDCPRYYVKNPLSWEQLKKDVKGKILLETIDKIKIELNGRVKEVAAVNIQGYNYVKLRDLADDKIEVSYDAERKFPIITAK